MKRIFCFIAAIAALAAAFTACESASSTIGGSLVEDQVEVYMDSSFILTGHSVVTERVQSRTTMQLIGSIDAEGYGSLQSDIVTQFMPGLTLDTEQFTAEDIDSVKLVMQMNNGCYTGDSIMPMGVTVYPLTRSLPSPIYSDFDPADYYDKSVVWGRSAYSASALGENDTIRGYSYRNIQVMLPREFAVKMYNEYKNSPSTFQTPQSFAEWFPGLYIANSFGSGRVTRIDRSFITMYYHVNTKSEKTGNDTTIYYTNTYLAVTPEIVTNNNIRYRHSSQLEDRVASGEALIVAPTGYDVEVTFPAQEIVDCFRQNSGPISMLNALSMEIPAEEIANDYGIARPQALLFVKKSKMAEFFAKNMITDGVNAFYAGYNASKGSYTFSDLRSYLEDLLKKEEITADDYEFVITPVNVGTETSGSSYNPTIVVTAITPYVTNPVMARLNLSKAKIKLTFSKQAVM